MLFSSEGKAVRFRKAMCAPWAAPPAGVRGIKLGKGTHDLPDYSRRGGACAHRQPERLRQAHRGGPSSPPRVAGTQGVIAMQTSGAQRQPGGRRAGVRRGRADADLQPGHPGATRGDEVSVLGRNTQGVRVIRTKEGEQLVACERIEEPRTITETGSDGRLARTPPPNPGTVLPDFPAIAARTVPEPG